MQIILLLESLTGSNGEFYLDSGALHVWQNNHDAWIDQNVFMIMTIVEITFGLKKVALVPMVIRLVLISVMVKFILIRRWE